MPKTSASTSQETQSSIVELARKREAATREILDLISQSREDAVPVFDAILRRVANLCGAHAAALVLGKADDTYQRITAQYGEETATDEMFSRGDVTMDPESSFSAEAILTGKVVHVPDTMETDHYRRGVPLVVSAVQDTGIRTNLYVPLLAPKGAVGCFIIYRREVRPYTPDEIALAETFAAQAVIAIENVRQFRELQKQLAREAATREILDVISQSRDDDRPVFDVVLRKAADLCNASLASLLITSEDRSHAVLVADRGLGQVSGLIQAGTTVWPMESGYAPSTCMREGRIVHIHDLTDTDLYRSGDPLRVAAVEEDGIRTVLAVPLFSGGQTVGCILVYRREVRPFSADEITLVETFAAQAVIAIENVRQFRELQERLAREAATKNILRVISESPDDEQPTFEAILDSATRLCGTQYASLVLGRRGDASQRMVAHRAATAETLAVFRDGKVPMDPKDSIAARAILEGCTIHVPDMADTDQYRAGHERFRLVVDHQGLRTNLFVPLLGPEGGIGCLILWKKEVAPFTADQMALMETFASHAVIAMENVRQFRELKTRLAREAATREILEIISQSRDDERPVFDAILRNAARLCEATTGGLVIGRSSDTHWRSVAMFGADALAEKLPDFGLVPMDPTQSITARAIVSGETVHTRDLLETQEYKNGACAARLVGDEIGARVLLNVPLMQKDGALGAIVLQRLVPVPFTQPQIELVQSFAAQAVIAIENVRQFRAIQVANAALQTRLAREAATREILEVISRNPDDDRPAFDAILGNAIRLCGADTSALILGRRGDPRMTLAAWRDKASSSTVHDDAMISEFNATDLLMDPAVHLSAQVIFDERKMQVTDILQTDGYLSGEPSYLIMADTLGVRTALIIPLIDARGALGVVHVHRRETRPFSDDEIALVETLAAQAVIAIENVRQFKALEALNTELGDRVEVQVGEIERMGRLKRFLPAAVADAVVSSGSEKLLSSHRALLGVLFCDIRGFTAFCETAEPEETIEVLQTYHEEMGRLINDHGAGVDHRMGDGIMVLFNDPLPCEDPAGDAVRLAMAMRARMAELCVKWKRSGYRLGFGLGVSLGYATVGMVGAGGRHDYTASGTAINLASRLCDEALDGEILISPRAWTAIEDDFTAESRGEIAFKGIREPVEVFCVTGVVA